MRFTLSDRDVEDLLAERRLDLSYETVLEVRATAQRRSDKTRKIEAPPRLVLVSLEPEATLA